MSYLLRAGIASSGRPDPVALGVIYSKTLGDNIADWTVTNPSGGVTFTVSGTDYIIEGTNGTGGTGASDLFQDYILLNVTDHAFTGLPKWKVRLSITTDVLGAATFGFSCGVISSNTFEELDSLCRIAQDDAFVGRSAFYYGDTDSTGTNDQTIPAGGFAIQDATTYIIEFEQDELTFTSRLYDSTGMTLHNSATTTDSPPGGTVAKVHHNTGQFAIAQHGGKTTIHSVEISSNSLTNCKSAFLGNSIAYGGKASALSEIWVEQFMASGTGTFVNTGRWADRMVDGETRINEIIALNPEFVFIALGSNDIKAGTWGTTGETALDNAISALQAGTSAQIVLVTATARNDVDVTQVKTDMDTKGLTVVDLFSVTKQGGNSMMLGTLNSGDGVHGNDLFHDTCSTEAIAEIPQAA